MAVNEKNVLLRSKESNGDTNIIYPITTLDNVDGFEEFQEQLNAAYKTVVRSVNGVTPDDSGNVVADPAGAADAALASAKEYTDSALAAYTPYAVQINTWEADD